jgi:hypothetical protein
VEQADAAVVVWDDRDPALRRVQALGNERRNPNSGVAGEFLLVSLALA